VPLGEDFVDLLLFFEEGCCSSLLTLEEDFVDLVLFDCFSSLLIFEDDFVDLLLFDLLTFDCLDLALLESLDATLDFGLFVVG
jgi:hypothetical protein